MFKYSIFLFLIILASCISKPENESSTISEEIIEHKTITIPKNVKNYLNLNFEGWRLVDSDDYDKIWWSFYKKEEMNYLASTDINDDKKADYALILTKNKTYQIIILFGSKDSFTHWIDSSFKNYGPNLTFGLTVEPPGRTDVIRPQIQSLILKSNAFNLMELENRACIYHSIDNQISVFKTK